MTKIGTVLDWQAFLVTKMSPIGGPTLSALDRTGEDWPLARALVHWRKKSTQPSNPNALERERESTKTKQKQK